jgi:UDP-N-acetylmuramyl pentapeptide phosphotransferase/UDP-N-acetylglucosamine-1-phosphate transferase
LVSALAIVTAGATAGFLIWNRHPAKIYMGDAGSLFLGIIVSVLTIRLSPGVVPSYKSLAIPLFLMATPILDTTVAVVSRLYRGISPFQGGRDHLSHRLMRQRSQSSNNRLYFVGTCINLWINCSHDIYLARYVRSADNSHRRSFMGCDAHFLPANSI